MVSSGGHAHRQSITFGDFCLVADQRLLLHRGTPVRLGARALDILIVLADRPGELVSQTELIARVWPKTFVDTANLRVNVAALRKALGDTEGRLISTDTGRGYRFTARVGSSTAATAADTGCASDRVPDRRPKSLPGAVTRLIGRDAFVASLADQLRQRRLITIVGPGGIGKTRIATASAESLAGSFQDDVGFADLTPARDAPAIAREIARALAIATEADDPLPELSRALRDRETLLVLDNCEHAIHDAATLVETLMMAAPGLHVIATSREPLRIAGEWVRCVPPLPSPPASWGLSAAEAMDYPAVELFVERAAAQCGFTLRDADAPLVGEICRRLDGVALAIELAAAQVEVFGLAWLAAHLSDQMWMLSRGRRTAVPRHQTLAALYDWSYRLLSACERETLHRIATFPGEFTLSDAIATAGDDGIGDLDIVNAVGGLVSKSLAISNRRGPVTLYHLPETTRAYALSRMTGAAARAAA